MEKKTEKSRGLGAQLMSFLFNLLMLVILGLIAWYIIFKSGWFTKELEWLHKSQWFSNWFSWWWFIPLVLIILFIFGIKAVFSPKKEKSTEKKKHDEGEKHGDEAKKADDHHHDEKKGGWAYAWDTFWTGVINAALMIFITIVVLFLIFKGCNFLINKLHDYTHGSEQGTTTTTYTVTKTVTLPPPNSPVETEYTLQLPPNTEVATPPLGTGQHYDNTPSADMTVFVHYPDGRVERYDAGPNKIPTIAREDNMYLVYVCPDSATVDVKILHP